MDIEKFIEQKLSKGGLLITSEAIPSANLHPHASVQVFSLEYIFSNSPINVPGPCVVVLETVNPDNRERFITVLAKLRDTAGKPVFVISGISDSMDQTDYIALGYQKVDQLREGHEVYYFSLRDYKRTPDWLNSKFWANPHMWDKARW